MIILPSAGRGIAASRVCCIWVSRANECVGKAGLGWCEFGSKSR